MLRQKIKNLIIGRKDVLTPNRISILSSMQWLIVCQLRTVFSLLNIRKRLVLCKIWRDFAKSENREVIVIAGGPSFTKELAEHILQNRDRFDVVALNFYCLADCAEWLVPDYYVLSDPASIFIDKKTENSKSRTLVSYLNKYKPKLCVPYGRYWNKLNGIVLRFDDVENLFLKNINPIYPRGYTSNTTFKAIALMLKAGYEKIYLMGLDYDYPRKLFLDKNNRIFVREEHHYGVVDIDHSEFYDSIGHALHWLSQDYWHVKKLKSPRVVNVSETSMIDAFSRVSPAEFIG